jgi:hypothetical protein
MRRALGISFLLVLVALVPSSLGQNAGYVVVNNDDFDYEGSNSATGDRVAAGGAISFLETLDTGGMGLGGGYFFATRIAIEDNAHCIFVADAGSSDIAAFEGPSFKKVVPNFSNSQLAGDYFGIGLAVDPAGKFLYSAWSASFNVAVLAIAPDCSLTLVGSPIPEPDLVANPTLTRDGGALVIDYPNLGGVQAYKTSSTGTLTALGPELVFANVIPACSSVGCFPAGQDVTDDGEYWVWGNSTANEPSTLTAVLTPQGFTNAALQTYPNTSLQNLVNPRLSPAAAQTGVGNLYLGASGFGTGSRAGIMVTTFNRGTITYATEMVNLSAFYAGQIQTVGTTGTGSPVVQIANDGDDHNTLYSYTVDGTNLTPVGSLSTNVTDGSFSFSIAAFPLRP